MNSYSRLLLLFSFAFSVPTVVVALASPPGSAAPLEGAHSKEAAGKTSPDPTPTIATGACSPDGKFVVLVSDHGTLRYSRAEDGSVLHTFYQCSPKALIFSADGSLLACAGGSRESGKIKIWSLKEGRLLGTLATDLAEVPALAFSPDGLWLVCTTGKTQLSLWRMGESKSRWSVSLNRAVSEVQFSSDGHAVLVRCADKSLRALGVADGSLLRTPLPGPNPIL